MTGDESELLGLFRRTIRQKRFLETCEFHGFKEDKFKEELIERGFHFKH